VPEGIKDFQKVFIFMQFQKLTQLRYSPSSFFDFWYQDAGGLVLKSVRN